MGDVEDLVDPRNPKQYSRAMLDCIEMRDRETLEKLLKMKGKVIMDDRYPRCYFPVHQAAVKGDVSSMELLIKYGHSIEQKDVQMRTALIVAIDNRELECAEYLIAEGANVNATCNTCMSALWHAVVKDDKEMVELLLKHDAALIMQHNQEIDFESLMRYPKSLMALCENGKALDYKDCDNKTLLMWVVSAPRDLQNRLAQCIPIAAEKGINLNAKDNQGRTALIYACEHGNAVAVRALLKSGATIENEDTAPEASSLLFRAIKSHNRTAVRYLLEGTSVAVHKIWQDEAKTRVVHYTAWKDDIDVFKMLLKHNWPLLYTGPDHKDSMLHQVAGVQGRRVLSKRCFKLLLKLWRKKGYSLGLESNYSCSPLFMACSAWNMDEVEMLLRAGVDPDLGDRDGVQPLTRLLRYALFPNTHWYPHVENAAHPCLREPNGQDPPAYPVLGSACLLFSYKCKGLQLSEIVENLLENAEQACNLVRNANHHQRCFLELDEMVDKVHLVVKDVILLLYSGYTGDKYKNFYLPLSHAVSILSPQHTLHPLLSAGDSWVRELGQPCSLKRACRDTIRSHLHPAAIPETVCTLGLPQVLEKYVLVLPEWDKYIEEIIEILKV